MSENAPNVFERTNILPDAVTLFVDKKVFDGWEDVQIVRELNSAASEFTVQVTDKWQDDMEPWRIQAGQKVHLHIGKKSVLTGHVDKVEASTNSTSRTITVSGRSLTADIVDCSTTLDNLPGLNLKEIAEKLISPFKIPIIFSADPGAAFSETKIQPGETIFQLLEKLTKQRKVLMMPSREGALMFVTAGTSRAHTPLKLGENVLSGSSTYDYTNRFSEYVTKGQDLGFLTPGEKSVQPMGRATDAGVTRYRPLVVINETPTDDGKSEDRASYEASLRKAQSLKAEIEVQGWFQANGELWDINQLVHLDCGFLGLRRQMLISKVTYNKSNAGTRCNLELVLPDSFDFKKDKKKEDPLGWAKPLK